MGKIKHGMSSHPAFKVWDGMMRRCYSEKHQAFNNYGGRGILVCDEWKNSPNEFIRWLESNGWNKGLQLDRTDNDKGYSPLNCRLVTPRVNLNNRRNTKMLFVDGIFISISFASEKYGINQSTIRERLKSGWSDYESVGLKQRERKSYIRKVNCFKCVNFIEKSGKWNSFAVIDGKKIHIGNYHSYDDAINARKEYLKAHGRIL